jgi:hypothetical protein
MRFGAVAFALGLALAVALVKLGAPPAARLLVAVPFFVGIGGLYAALTKNCFMLAVQGKRDVDDDPVDIADPAERAAVQRLARLLLALSAISAAAATTTFLLLG